MTNQTFAARLQLFPLSTQVKFLEGQNRLTLADLDLVNLAEEYGTPLYLYDQATVQNRIETYRHALAISYPANSAITYAGKAYLSLAVARWMAEQELYLDCTGIGEIMVAVAAEVPRNLILVHGVNKTHSDLAAAVEYAGTIVADNQTELNHLAKLKTHHKTSFPDIWLRFRPGLAVDTHHHRQTGQVDSKFGLDQQDFLSSIEYCLEHELPLTGIHFHQGSHFHNPEPLKPAIDAALETLVKAREMCGWTAQVFCPGGGWGVPYHEQDLPHPPIQEYVEFVSVHLVEACQLNAYPLPRLQLEPGRSLIAQAGVALYRVGDAKLTGGRRWLLVDGGLADNPRPALYGSRYSALPVVNPERSTVGPAWIAGPYCESGDVLINALPMADLQEGELIAIPVSGAYHLSMSSNYNGARRPAVIWLEPGIAHLIQKRETLEDLYRRDQLIGSAKG